MSLYQWLCVLGIPSLIAVLIRCAYEIIHKNKSDIGAVKSGVQALLRAQMIHDYNSWSAREYAPIYARENFENCWAQYHALGANGVMDDLHRKFLELPTEKEQ